jgi:hypothetical protein
MPQNFIDLIRQGKAGPSDGADLEPPKKRQRLSSDPSEGQKRSEDEFVTVIKVDVELVCTLPHLPLRNSSNFTIGIL